MPPKKAGKPASKKIWFGTDLKGEDGNGNKLSTLQDWWKSFEAAANTEAAAAAAVSNTSEDSEPNKTVSKSTENNVPPAIKKWYGVSEKYWTAMDASDSGMLAGYESTSDVDIAASREFIQQFIDGLKDTNLKVTPTRCIDVGAGIGRISKLFLSKLFEKVDLLEQSPVFINKAKEELLSPSSGCADKIGEFYCAPVQDFEFPAGVKYDVIWIQWVLLYMLDVDLIAFLKRCKAALQPHGVIIIKENVAREMYYIDTDDNSITRMPMHFKTLFASAGLRLLRDVQQPNWPSELFPVRMWAVL